MTVARQNIEVKRDGGTRPISGRLHLVALAHHISKRKRRRLIELALGAVRLAAERAEAKGIRRRGPKGDEIARLAAAIGRAKSTVKDWIRGNIPSDRSVARILEFLQGQDGAITNQLVPIIERDVAEYESMARAFVDELDGEPKRDGGIRPISEQGEEATHE